MVRTQVQLTEAQVARLRALAAREDVSIAELVRRLVDDAAEPQIGATWEERKQIAIAVVGRFASGGSDVSAKHDRYLADAFGS